MIILSTNYYNYFVTKKKSLNNISYRKLSLNCKQQTTRKEHVLMGYLYFPAPGPRSLFVFSGPGPQFVYTGPGPQFVFTGPG